tara:strand:- start:1385 stop:1606 length:222 start_codon:yes stop_codon:yes gene_type:complete
MLSDFLSLEQYYGTQNAALYFEDVLSQYEEDAVFKALEQGYLIKKIMCIGPDCGRCLCWLSDDGRSYAQGGMH